MNTTGRTSLARPMLAALGLYALTGLFTPAAAQSEPAPAPAPGRDQAVEVETVIVTARRREESIQNTPVSVTAISPTQLQNAAAPDIRDLSGRAPSLIIDQVNAGPSAAAISIRGISFEDIEKSFDPAVGVLIDDIYIGTNTGQLTDTFDLQSVQVLRGPQGTLFGRNTIGGVVSVTRTRPTGQLGASIDAIFGDYGRREYHAVVNLPQIGDQLSTKLFISSRQADGYQHNATLNRDSPKTNVLRYGATFLWQPVEAFDLNLTVEHARERSETDQAPLSTSFDLICAGFLPPPLNAPPFEAPASECNRNNKDDLYTTFSNKIGANNSDENDVTAQANWRIGKVTLTSVTGWRSEKEHVVQDFDASSTNFFDTVRNQKYQQFSQELRASGNLTSTVDYVVGGYYFDSKYNLFQTTNYGLLLQLLAGLPATGFQAVDHHSKSYAAFADVDWEFLPRWRLSLGGRYTKDKKSIENNFVGAFDVSAHDSWSEFTPKVSVDYRPTDLILLYASYSKGFRSGGFNGRGSTVFSASTPYNPEKVDAYELGAKTEWFDHRLIFNAAIFDTEYHNKQEEVVQKTPPGSPDPQETIVANAATARIRGIEFDAQAQPTRALSLRATLGYLDAKYDNFPQTDPLDATTGATLIDDLSTLTLRRAPKFTGGVGFDYKIPTGMGDWTLTADYRYIGKHQTAIVADPGTGIFVPTTAGGCDGASAATPTCVFVPAVSDPRALAQEESIVDLSLSWEHDLPTGVVRISLFGRNLLDDRGLAGALPVAGLFTFGTARPPRTYGVQLGYKF